MIIKSEGMNVVNKVLKCIHLFNIDVVKCNWGFGAAADATLRGAIVHGIVVPPPEIVAWLHVIRYSFREKSFLFELVTTIDEDYVMRQTTAHIEILDFRMFTTPERSVRQKNFNELLQSLFGQYVSTALHVSLIDIHVIMWACHSMTEVKRSFRVVLRQHVTKILNDDITWNKKNCWMSFKKQ